MKLLLLLVKWVPLIQYCLISLLIHSNFLLISQSASSVQAFNNKLFIAFFKFNDIYNPLWLLEFLSIAENCSVLQCDIVAFVFIEAWARELNTWIRLTYVTLFAIHGSFDARCLLMMERGEAIIDIPKVDAAGSRTETLTSIMMCLLKATIKENLEIATKGRLSLTRWNCSFTLINKTLFVS